MRLFIISIAAVFLTFSAGAKENLAWFTHMGSRLHNNNLVLPENSFENKVAKSMVTLYSGGVSQGTQVCPGVFLVTSHGISEDTRTSKKLDKMGLYFYPVSSQNLVKFTDLKPDEIISGWFDYNENTSTLAPKSKYKSSFESDTDYAFIVFNARELFRFTQREGISYSASNYVPVASYVNTLDSSGNAFLFRPPSIFPENSDSNYTYEVNERTLKFPNVRSNRKLKFKRVYDQVYRTKEPCILKKEEKSISNKYQGKYMEHAISSSCPSEKSVSGSPLVDRKKLMGIVVDGSVKSANKKEYNSKNSKFGSLFLSASAFYSDYLKACEGRM